MVRSSDPDGEPLPWGIFRTEVGKTRWLGEKIEGWQDFVLTLAVVDIQHLQTAYAGLHHSL